LEATVFKVVGYIRNNVVPLGSATLIHPAGYFVTASHVFDQNGTVLEAFPDGYPINEKLTLKNSRGVSIDARIYRLRSSTSGPDIALIRADADLGWNLPLPDVSLGWLPGSNHRWYPVFSNEDLAMLGYKLSELLPDYNDFRPSQLRIDQNTDQIFLALVTQGMPFNGESGSAAITRTALSQGVLKGSSDEDAAGNKGATYLFTPTAYLIRDDWLSNLPKTPQVAAMLSKLRSRSLTQIDRQTLFEQSWKEIDLVQIVSAVLANPAEFKGLDSDIVQFMAMQCNCRGMLGLSTKLLAELPRSLVNSAAYLDSARIAMSFSEQQNKINAPARIHQATVASALKSFELYGKIAKLSQGSKFQSFAWYDYALTLKQAMEHPALEVSNQQVKSAASKAAELYPGNYNAWILLASVEKNEENYKAAIDYTQKAISPNPPNKRQLTKDIDWYRGLNRGP